MCKSNLRSALHKHTKLDNRPLDDLVEDLRHLIACHRGLVEMDRSNPPIVVAKSFQAFASTYEKQADILRTAPPFFRAQFASTEEKDLMRRATLFRRMAEFARADAKRGRPPEIRKNEFAAAVRDAIVSHCGLELPLINRRYAIAAALDEAGCDYDDPVHNPDKFDQMVGGERIDAISEAAQERGRALRDKIGDQPW